MICQYVDIISSIVKSGVYRVATSIVDSKLLLFFFSLFFFCFIFIFVLWGWGDER